MTEDNGNKIIAQRYANALLDFSDKDLTKEQILSEISDILLSVEGSDELKKVISSPVIRNEEKKNILNKIFSDNNKIVLNFLNLLIDKNRFSILSQIVDEYKTEINKINHLLEMKIISAIDLNESEKAMIKIKLENVLNRKLELKWATDKSLIGGLTFCVDDRVIDCSIKHKLSEIENKIIL